jgi:hypothetical protein
MNSIRLWQLLKRQCYGCALFEHSAELEGLTRRFGLHMGAEALIIRRATRDGSIRHTLDDILPQLLLTTSLQLLAGLIRRQAAANLLI